MTIVTGWRAELAIIDGAQVLRTRGDSCMAWPAFWYEVLDDAHEIALKEDADREWVARELGDVVPRYSTELVTRASLAGLSVESMLPVEDFNYE